MSTRADLEKLYAEILDASVEVTELRGKLSEKESLLKEKLAKRTELESELLTVAPTTRRGRPPKSAANGNNAQD